MAIKDILKVKTTEGGEEVTEKFVGLKLPIEDYIELTKVLDVTPTTGGSALFKTMLAIVLEAKGYEG